MLCLSVGDQVGDERRCELVVFGPDGEGPAEISAGEATIKLKNIYISNSSDEEIILQTKISVLNSSPPGSAQDPSIPYANSAVFHQSDPVSPSH